MLPVIRKRSYLPSFADEFFGPQFLNGIFSDGADYTVPAVNIKENDKQFEIELAVPGLDKKDIKINIENDILQVSSEKELNKEAEKEGYRKREFTYSSFCRRFSLPENVEVEKIKATQNNGVLRIELPKIEESKLNHKKEIKIS